MNIGRRGFTLIEILIVVAIIAILASVVLVGLGPTQQAGRDARRLSDLREVQNGLELFYQNCGVYPGSTSGTGNCQTTPSTWSGTGSSLSSALTTEVPNIGQIPVDPSTNRTYAYFFDPAGSGYALGAVLENQNNSVFNTYTAPDTTNLTSVAQDAASLQPAQNCIGTTPNLTYCVSL